VHNVTGGAIRGTLDSPSVTESIARKTVTSIEYEDFLVAVGMDMAKGLSQWISAAFDQG
jgi:hypothetical protein